MSNRFERGEPIRLKAEPDRLGVVMEILPAVGSATRYRVFHAAGEIREYDEVQLAPSVPPTEENVPGDDKLSNLYLGSEEFRARLTATRLAHPLTDNLYALHAARIRFIPFQFRPLLRLLRSDQPRILIADEVGVGKTIEAGLILKELQSRQTLDNVLIVCPKALVTKWQAEMRRFDEEFHPLTAESLRYCLREADLDGQWPAKYARAIVHLELFRGRDYLVGSQGRNPRPGLGALDPSPHFSLTIFDEAHHLRSPASNANQLARMLCEMSEAVVLLSATPIQLGSKNLFTLLNLLRPDLFQDEVTFREMIAPNQYLTQAMRHIRSRMPADEWMVEAVENLRTAAETSWGKLVLEQDPRFSDSLKSLSSLTILTDEQRIHCLRDLEEVHTLAHLMNRTRRRDIGRFTLREPHTVSVSFTPEQEEFYRALIDFRREALALNYSPVVIRLIIDSLERQAASCLPALAPMLDRFLRQGKFSVEEHTDDIDEEDEIELTAELQERADELRSLAAALPPRDPKWEALANIAETTRDDRGPGKLLVFSFFLHTLRYLSAKLSRAGFRVGVVTGKVEEEERQRLRDRFRKPRRDPDALDILLSSEVGCEGLDYEFCDRMVNYDIPWNPMRLEQRIGRIDRFGQTAEKVLIFNFITPGTVEERIFFRCFDRLGIFRDTIGDCEEVLGSEAVTEQLLELARNPHLTPEQAEEKARQITDNALRLLEEQRRLETEGSDLLGMDQVLNSEIDAMEAEGRYVTPLELRAMLSFFVSRPELGGALEPDREQPKLYRLRLNREARLLLADRLRSRTTAGRATQVFRQWLEGNDPHLILTFDQEMALNRRDLPFITPVHPLTRLAVESLKQTGEAIGAHLTLRSTEISVGRYAIACDLWETISLRPEIRLVTVAWNLTENKPAPEVANQFLRLLSDDSLSAASSEETRNLFDKVAFSLDENAYQQRQRAIAELRARNELLVQRQLASLETYYKSRLKRIETELSNAQDSRIQTMKIAERNRAEGDFLQRRKEIERRRNADILTQRIASGILEIVHE